VTIVDEQPPTLSCPPDVVVGANRWNGCTLEATVTFPAPAVADACPGVSAPDCTPASGSVFAEGTTTVTCTARDAAGNAGSCSFAVTVEARFDVCVVGDGPADTFSIVTDPASPAYKFWCYRVAATGETICGVATRFSNVATRSLVTSDTSGPAYTMTATISWAAKTAVVEVRRRSTGRTTTLRDANILDDPPCP
jgi:hypothetical protein